jgi:hypothetical protein
VCSKYDSLFPFACLCKECDVNVAPVTGLVMKSPIIFSVGQYSISASFLSIMSVMRKFVVLKCQLLLLEVILPFFSSFIELKLSHLITFFISVIPCYFKNSFVHSIFEISLSIDINSAISLIFFIQIWISF